VPDGSEHERPGVRRPRQLERKRRPLPRDHDYSVYKHAGDHPEYLDGPDDDKPDVEFNDDGSVHINTPGDYYFGLTHDYESIVYARRLDTGDDYHRANPDDPALD
jgi:hypothetical protein